MLYQAALKEKADGRAWQRELAGAKAYITENVDHIAREAVQMHGGIGVTDETSNWACYEAGPTSFQTLR